MTHSQLLQVPVDLLLLQLTRSGWLSVGWDSQFTCNRIIFGEPDDIDEFVQKIECRRLH